MAKLSLEFFLLSSRFFPVQEIIIDCDNFSQSAFNGKSVKILNWNIAKKNNNKTWKKDFLWILEAYKPDIICLQEACLNTKKNIAFELESMGWNFAPNFFDVYQDHHCGILTGSKVKPLARRSILTQDYEPIAQTPKVSLIAEYPFLQNHNTLLVVNTHAINFVELHKFRLQLQKLEEFIYKHNEPIIISGDFNTWNQLRLDLLNQMAARLNLTNVTFTLAGKRKIKKFLFSPPLDHIYYRGLQEKKDSAIVLDQISSSDHKPMLVEFFIQE
jgi:endonuclease/exonuclease/phosphatase (EEP) superfamily protein YafD